MAPGAQSWSWRTGLQDAVVTASVGALTETAAAFLTGRFPAVEAISIPALTLAAGVALGLPVTWMAHTRGLRDLGTLQLTTLLPLLCLVVAHASTGWPIAAMTVVGVSFWLRPGRRPRGLTPTGLATLAFATFAFATIVCVAARSPWSVEGRIGDWQIAAPALVAGAMIAAFRRGTSTRALQTMRIVAGVMVTCGIIGGGLANEPLSIPRTAPPITQPPSRSKSVLLIVMDTVRRDRTSLYGYAKATTPSLEALSRRSVVFERANASASYSLPSHASLFSGLRPSEHGAHASAGPAVLGLRPDVVTLPEALTARGYDVAGVSANPVIFSSVTGMRRVFPNLASSLRRDCGHVPLPLSLLSRLYGPKSPTPCQQTWAAADVTDASLSWLGDRASRPFFLFVNYFDAHWPYSAPLEFRNRFPPPPPASGPEGGYDAAVAYVDSEIGRLLRGLEQLGRIRDTIVVVTADHGELLGEAGLFGHPAVPMEEVLAVPLLIAPPGSSVRTNESRRVAHRDVRKMIEAALGGASPDRLLEAPDSREPFVASETWTTTDADPIPRLTRVVYDGRYKLAERADGTVRLFDLTQPDFSRSELTGPEVRQTIDRIRAQLPPLIEPPKRAGGALSPEQLESLRALGYIGR